MQSDATLEAAKRRNYTSFFNAAKRIPTEEGITALWAGGVPTIIRAMALNLGMFTTYEESKERLAKHIANKNAVFLASSTISGAVAATMSLPFDNAKTKLQA